MEKNNIFIAVSIIVILGLLFFAYKKSKGVPVESLERQCFDLPTSVDPTVFGPKYWEAFHKLAAEVPCGGCRGFAEKFMVYFHDLVNLKTDKPIFDKATYEYFNKSIAKLNGGNDFKTAFNL